MRFTAHNFHPWQAPPHVFIVLYLRTSEQQHSPYYQHLLSHPFEVPSVLRVVASFHHYFRCTSPLTCPAVVSSHKSLARCPASLSPSLSVVSSCQFCVCSSEHVAKIRTYFYCSKCFCVFCLFLNFFPFIETFFCN